MIKIVKSGSQMAINTPYNADFVQALKNAIPQSHRSWNKPNWVVSDRYESDVIDLLLAFYGEMPYITNGTIQTQRVEQLLRVEYIGRCKDKNTSEPVASGWCNGGWNVLIKESSMRLYFDGDTSKKEEETESDQNLYQILGVQSTIKQEDLKSAFRRMSKQWHPDVCKESGAHERFLKINDAYKLLSDVLQRRKYDFILSKMEDLKYNDHKDRPFIHARTAHAYNSVYGYRSPLRCGMLLVEGEMQFGKLVVDRILQWDDIIQDDRVMVSSWRRGDDHFTVDWV